jgi:hypothetical protein
MTVIMLKGPGSCGKTTTLNLVYEELIRAGAAITKDRAQLGANPKDFAVELSYAQKGAAKKVAIFSMGDYAKEVIKAMKKFAGIGFDVLIIACNEDFVTPFYELNKYPGSPRPVVKTRNPPETITLEDLKIARQILALL